MSYDQYWDLKDMAYQSGSLDDGSYYDDGENDFYLGDEEEAYPRENDCE
jgi:hypothetical protein